MATAIEISELTFSYPPAYPEHHPEPVLRDISIAIEAGQFVALMGPVGAGKTTLCLTLNGLIPQVTHGDFRGRVAVNGHDTQVASTAQIAACVGMVFQDTEIQLFNSSVEDEIAFGLETLNWAAADIEARIDWALDAVGLRGFRHRSPRTLSGGEQRRLAIASILAMAPPILLLDEPTAGLDPCGKAAVLDVIDHLTIEHRLTVVMVSQEAEIVARYADRLLILDEGRIIADGTPASIFSQLAKDANTSISVPQMSTLSHLLGQRYGTIALPHSPEQACRDLQTLRREGRVSC